MELTGNVFAIKKYALHDGPNIRTTVFFKGCPLKCWWCHNPEGMDRNLSVIWIADKCIGCGECLAACPTKSLSVIDGEMRRDATCQLCHACVTVCPALAHEAVGWKASVDDIIAEIEKDTPFYDESGGGVTFSGGEPLMQPDYLLEVLRQCGKLGVHRAVDTTTYAKRAVLLQIAENCELLLVDLKHMDSDKHKLYTGVPNEQILQNIRVLAENNHSFRIRIPLIEGVNSDEDNIRLSGDFLTSLPHPPEVDLLPYHNIAEAKYRKMARTYPAVQFQPIAKEKIAACSDILTRAGLHVRIGG